MKKALLLIVSLVLVVSACSIRQKDGEAPRPPAELSKIKDSFSALYRVMLEKEAGEVSYASAAGDEDESVPVAAGFPAGGAEQGSETEAKERIVNKSYHYLKEILKYIENARLLMDPGLVPAELAEDLDKTVNRLAHQINRRDSRAAVKTINDGLYLISAIMERYGQESGACVLQLEYCLNLLEIEAGDRQGMEEALALTAGVIKELRETAGANCTEGLDKMQKSVDSLHDAAAYDDARLVRMKVEVMRENLKNISVLAINRNK